MNANKVLRARKLIRKLNFTDCEKLAKQILKMTSAEDIENKLKEYLRQVGQS